MPLILASQSPRRSELLRMAGIPHEVRAADVPEQPEPGETPEQYVRRLAEEKARSVAGDLVVAADTVVVVGGQILGKPKDAEDATRMLRLLSGRDHLVITGICVKGRETVVDVETTRVWFTELTLREIREYVASGEPMDKAGAYGIQGLASKFVERIEGSYSNVVGLPVAKVYHYWKALNGH
jgi:septum formation protein